MTSKILMIIISVLATVWFSGCTHNPEAHNSDNVLWQQFQSEQGLKKLDSD